MAWEWVAPVCTAGVGVVGIAATSWTARQGRKSATNESATLRAHADAQRDRAEKRVAYLDFLQAASDARRTILDARAAMRRESPDHDEARALALEASSQLSRSREQLRLVAPERVRLRARDINVALMEALQASTRRSAEPITVDPNLNASLLAEMKRDLGYELAGPDREALELPIRADSVRTEAAE